MGHPVHMFRIATSSDLPMDFVSHYRASWLGAAVLGALSCCNGDTWASELGSVWSEKSPWLITR